MKNAVNKILNNDYTKVSFKNDILHLEKKLNFFGTKKYKQQLQGFEILIYAKKFCKENNIYDKINFEEDIKTILVNIEKEF